MSNDLPSSLPPKLQERLLACLLQIQAPSLAEKLWERYFTDEERQRLGGDLEEAFAQGGAIGMWRRLHDVDEQRALVEVGRLIGGLSAGDYEWACRELKLSPSGMNSTSAPRPFWNRETLELSFEGEIIRRIGRANVATNLLCLLNTFEAEGWPSRVDDPLPGPPDAVRLHKAVRSLNRGLTLIKFHTDGTGEGVRWELGFMV